MPSHRRLGAIHDRDHVQRHSQNGPYAHTQANSYSRERAVDSNHVNHRGGSLNRGDNNRASQSPQTYNHVPGNTSPLRHRSRGADSNDQRVSSHQIAVGGGDLSQGADQQSSLNVSQVHPQNLNSNNLRMRDGSNSAAIRSPANEARSIPRVGDSITK